jgi:GNAT superfamily N-acetyltransferase
VHPIAQGKGYAKALMDFAENKARKEGFQSVRLDTFSLNEKNVAFYTKRGYSRLGDIYFPIKSKAPFHCFELPIS